MKKLFNTKEELQDFLDNSMTCVCGGLLTGLHEMTCSQIQKLKVMFMGNQDKTNGGENDKSKIDKNN